MNGDGRFALEPTGSSGSGWSDDMMASPVRGIGGEGEGGLLLSPKNVHALRTLFDIAHRLAGTLGKSWALVRTRGTHGKPQSPGSTDPGGPEGARGRAVGAPPLIRPAGFDVVLLRNRCWRRCRTWSVRCSRRTPPRRTGRGQQPAGKGPMEGHYPATACRRTWPSSPPPPRR